MAEKIQTLWDRIGIKKGVDIDLDMAFLTAGAQGTEEKQADDDKSKMIQIKEEAPEQDDALFVNQTEVLQKNQGKCHWDFLLKELEWMAEDFDRETKKNQGDSKKFARNCKKHLHEKQIT